MSAQWNSRKLNIYKITSKNINGLSTNFKKNIDKLRKVAYNIGKESKEREGRQFYGISKGNYKRSNNHSKVD